MPTDTELERAKNLASVRSEPTPSPESPVQGYSAQDRTTLRQVGISSDKERHIENETEYETGGGINQQYQLRKQEKWLEADYQRAQRAGFRELEEMAHKHSRPSFIWFTLILTIILAFDTLDVLVVLLAAGLLASGVGAQVSAIVAILGTLIEIIPASTVLTYLWTLRGKYEKYREFQEAMQRGYAMSRQRNSAEEAYEDAMAFAQELEEQNREQIAEQAEKPETIGEGGDAEAHLGETNNRRLALLKRGQKIYGGIQSAINIVENPWGFVKTLIFVGLDRIKGLDIIPFDTWTVMSSYISCRKSYKQIKKEWEEYQKSDLARV